MTIPLTERRRIARHRRSVAYWWVVIGWMLSLWLSTQLVPQEWLHYVMLIGHLGCVIVGLGAAVLLEVNGFLWMRGAASLDHVRRTEPTVTGLAWVGIIGLLATGAFLEPDLGNPLTVLKMAAVLLAALNGVAMTRMTAELHRMHGEIPFDRIPRRMKIWAVWSAIVSQVAWWTAVIVGAVNTATG